MSLEVQIHLVQKLDTTHSGTTLNNAFQTIVAPELPIHLNFTVAVLVAGLDPDEDASVGIRLVDQNKPNKPMFVQEPQIFNVDAIGDGNNVFFQFDLANIGFEKSGNYEIQAIINQNIYVKNFNVKK